MALGLAGAEGSEHRLCARCRCIRCEMMLKSLPDLWEMLEL